MAKMVVMMELEADEVVPPKGMSILAGEPITEELVIGVLGGMYLGDYAEPLIPGVRITNITMVDVPDPDDLIDL